MTGKMSPSTAIFILFVTLLFVFPDILSPVFLSGAFLVVILLAAGFLLLVLEAICTLYYALTDWLKR
jgi:hypothetical protein